MSDNMACTIIIVYNQNNIQNFIFTQKKLKYVEIYTQTTKLIVNLSDGLISTEAVL